MPSATVVASLSFALATSGIALGAGQEDRRTPARKPCSYLNWTLLCRTSR